MTAAPAHLGAALQHRPHLMQQQAQELQLMRAMPEQQERQGRVLMELPVTTAAAHRAPRGAWRVWCWRQRK
jgi:hypothetical protein